MQHRIERVLCNSYEAAASYTISGPNEKEDVPVSSWYISQTVCTTAGVSRGGTSLWWATKLTRAALKSAMCLVCVSITLAKANRSSL